MSHGRREGQLDGRSRPIAIDLDRYVCDIGRLIDQSIKQSREYPRPPARALLPHEVHLVLLSVVDFQLRHGRRGLGDEFSIAEASRVLEELFLQVLGDIVLDDDVVAVLLLFFN